MRAHFELQAFAQQLDLPGAIRILDKVMSWEVYPARLETVSRYQKALELKQKLQMDIGDRFLQETRDYLAGLAIPFQELCDKSYRDDLSNWTG